MAFSHGTMLLYTWELYPGIILHLNIFEVIGTLYFLVLTQLLLSNYAKPLGQDVSLCFLYGRNRCTNTGCQQLIRIFYTECNVCSPGLRNETDVAVKVWHVLPMREDMAKKVLIAGGAGYIGSHCVLELLEIGYHPVVIDNFHNAIKGEAGVPESLRRVEEITGKKIDFEQVDVLDAAALDRVFHKHKFSAVLHFAGLKAVGESVEKPLDYYKVNVTGTLRLLETMRAHGVKNIVFSSSATVYGDPAYLPIDEKHPVGGCTNPYGKTKYFIEEMIQDLCKAEKDWNAVLLRYFNPIGAHISGKIGEDPQGIPNNLMPYVAQVAIGRREYLGVFGNDYNTCDGTGVRDYIHIVDLAKGHIAALKKLEENCGCKIYNLGTGTGYSVLQMVKAMEKASGKEIRYKIAPRREGDIASCYADPTLATCELGWKAEFGLDRMCEDLWRWQSQNPTGFSKGTDV